MSALQKMVVHDCQPPEVADVTARHRWTCDDCGGQWEWSPERLERHHEWHGVFYLSLRTVEEVIPGKWCRWGQAPRSWVDV